MKILEYADYNDLQLPKGIVLTNAERMKMCKIISDAIHTYYNFDRNDNRIIEVDGMKLNTEYLSKAINNRTLLKKIIFDPNGEIISNIKNKADLFSFVENNLYDLFSPKGKYFKNVYYLLSNTSVKGKRVENAAFQKFEEVAKGKGLNIKVEEPTTQEDLGGLDGYFIHNGKRFTIQVKPLHKIETYKKDTTKYIVFCDGVLKTLTTDYLIVSNDRNVWIFRSKDVLVNPSFFLIPKTNLVR